jgi:hypothetical protein
MNRLFLRPLPLIGIAAGALAGGAAYALTRVWLPSAPPFGAVVVGLLAGVGARLGRAVGVRSHMKTLVYGSMLMAFVGEFAAFLHLHPDAGFNGFPDQIASHPVSLMLMMLFLVAGLFLGVKVLVGDGEGVYDDGQL